MIKIPATKPTFSDEDINFIKEKFVDILKGNSFLSQYKYSEQLEEDYALYTGVPGKHVGWMSSYGEKINLPLKGEGSWFCEKSNTLYTLNQTDLIANKTS